MQKNFSGSQQDNDTIAALCTAPGGALAIIRISGPEALSAASKVWRGRQPLSAETARIMHLGKACPQADGASGEPCLAVYMKGPRSYTGEDTVELQCHGGAFAPKRLLNAVLAAGARLAEPGEFTKRAFLNGRMDLTQAEAVADLINAKSESAAHLAEKQMSGLIGSTVRTERGKLLHVLAEVESRLDFPEEDLDWLPPENLNAVLNGCIKVIERMIRSRENGAILRNGMRVVIAGRPNSGKSSLLNALLGYDRAIVTPLPGTTRDTLEEFASFHGIPVRLTDTAGLRETAADPIENMGISRSRDSMRSAEIIFWVMDASSPAAAQESLEYMNSQIRNCSNLIVVWNKIDLNPDPERLPLLSGTPSVRISALRGEGLENLLDVFENRVWHKSESSETECEVSARHAGLLESAKSELQQAAREIASGFWELAASCLHAAIAALGGVTGEDANPDMLDEIFSRFCIGK